MGQNSLGRPALNLSNPRHHCPRQSQPCNGHSTWIHCPQMTERPPTAQLWWVFIIPSPPPPPTTPQPQHTELFCMYLTPCQMPGRDKTINTWICWLEMTRLFSTLPFRADGECIIIKTTSRKYQQGSLQCSHGPSSTFYLNDMMMFLNGSEKRKQWCHKIWPQSKWTAIRVVLCMGYLMEINYWKPAG